MYLCECIYYVIGVGTVAKVVDNFHLTQLVKITFKKKDPELVHIYIIDSANTTNTSTSTTSDMSNNHISFRIVRKTEFINALQV